MCDGVIIITPLINLHRHLFRVGSTYGPLICPKCVLRVYVTLLALRTCQAASPSRPLVAAIPRTVRFSCSNKTAGARQLANPLGLARFSIARFPSLLVSSRSRDEVGLDLQPQFSTR